MPKKNQKKMSEEERSAIEAGRLKRKREQAKNTEVVEKAKNELFEEHKKLLPEILEARKNEVISMIEQKVSMPYSSIYNVLSKTPNYAVRKSYTNDELLICFNEFKAVIDLINTKKQFVPSKNLFCAYIGVSTSTYDGWLMSNSDDRREIMQMIDDYIADVMLTSAQNKQTDAYVSVYRGKSQHKIIEAQNPIVIEHKTTTDIDEIRKRVSNIKSGKIIEADFKEK